MNIKYKPRPRLGAVNHEEAFSRHFESQVLMYGKQVAINLIDSKGVEGQLCDEFRQMVEACGSQMVRDNVRYEYFDFHHECRKMRWDRLALLMERTRHDME